MRLHREPYIELTNVYKDFGSVRVLRDISLQLPRAQVTGLVGDNGAGKSTLVGILSGLHTPTSGRLRVESQDVQFAGPREAISAGIETVFQSLALIPTLDVTENMFLGRERRRTGPLGTSGIVDHRRMRRLVAEYLTREGVGIPAHGVPVGSLSGGQRQIVAVLRATFWGAKYVLLDEPTAALGVRQRGLVLDYIRKLRDAGIGVLLISHNLEEVMQIVDHVIVLRLGRKSIDEPVEQVSHERLVLAMSGLATS